MRAPIEEIRRLLGKAITKKESLAAELKGATNPQTIKIMHEAEATAIAYKGALEALHGSLINLRIDAGE